MKKNKQTHSSWSPTASSAYGTFSKGCTVRGRRGGWPRRGCGHEGRLVSMEGRAQCLDLGPSHVCVFDRAAESCAARGAGPRPLFEVALSWHGAGPLGEAGEGCTGPLCVLRGWPWIRNHLKMKRFVFFFFFSTRRCTLGAGELCRIKSPRDGSGGGDRRGNRRRERRGRSSHSGQALGHGPHVQPTHRVTLGAPLRLQTLWFPFPCNFPMGRELRERAVQWDQDGRGRA